MVVVDVGHPRTGIDGAGDLVDGACGRQAGAEVDELADPFAGQEPYCAAQERPVVPGCLRRARDRRQQPLCGPAVSRIVVLTAEEIVVVPASSRRPVRQSGHSGP
jgi:hypothetical protein